jgi:hypothetical protein
MGRRPRSGNTPNGRHVESDWFNLGPDTTDDDTRADTSEAPDVPADHGDWIESLQEVDFTGDAATQERKPPPRWWDEEGLPSPESEVDTGIERDDTTRADAEQATPTAAVANKPKPRRSRQRVAIASAIGVLLVGAAVGFVALTWRGSGTKATSSATTTATSGKATATTAGAPTTVAPGVAMVPPAGPGSFTAHSTCGGRDCTVAVRDGPGTTAKRVDSLRTGQVVQIDCSTHGEPVTDRDTGRTSDVWYRQTVSHNYSSALYLDGPPVPDCG